MPKIKVRSGKPLPAKGSYKKVQKSKYPFVEMEIGDSFYIRLVTRKISPTERYKKLKKLSTSIYQAARRYSKLKSKIKIQFRMTDKDSEISDNPTGISCWRTE